MTKVIQKGDLDIKIMVLGSVLTNCYVLSNHETKEAVIVDPGDSPDIIKEYVKEAGLFIVGILLTHGHFDHILAASELASYFRTKIYAAKEEKELLNDAEKNCSRNIGMTVTLEAHVYLEDKDMITLAGQRIKVIHTPGHTAGCVCYYFMNQDVLLTGDTLFYESIGRTDLPTGNSTRIIQSINEKLMVLEESITVFPGHGDATTIDHEKKNNPYLRGWEF